jgi:hypothetical protein
VHSDEKPESRNAIEKTESLVIPGSGTIGQASATPEAEEDVVFRPNPGPQTAFLAASEREVLYGGAGGGGKRLPKSLILLAFSDGKWSFKQHGDLVVGDYVMHPSGKPVKVTHIHPDYLEDVWELEVDSGVVIPCSGTHKWRTLTLDERVKNTRRTPEFRAARRAKRPSRAKANSKKPWLKDIVSKRNSEAEHNYLDPIEAQSRSTKEIADTLTAREGSHINHSMAVTAPVETAKVELPVDPYWLGLWLGDGYYQAPKIGMAEDDIYQIMPYLKEKPTYCKFCKTKLLDPNLKPYYEVMWYVKDTETGQAWKKAGLYKNKHIPEVYLTASAEDRLALLQGLMDTDGTCTKSGSCELTLKLRHIVEDVQTLLASFGIKSTIGQKVVPAYPDNTYYHIKFTTSLPMFRLKRKLDRQPKDTRDTTKNHYIVDVRKTDRKEIMNCISVDHPDGQYLVTRNFIPTRNSYAVIMDVFRYATRASHRALVLRRTNDELRELISKAQELYPRAYPGCKWRERQSEFWFPSGARIWFTYLEQDKDVQRYVGQSFTQIAWDELTQWATPYAYNFLRSRLRSTDPNIPLSVRATTNPGHAGMAWVKKMFINPSPPGKAFWATDIETGETLVYPKGHPKAGQPLFKRRFIPARLQDNPYLYASGDYEAMLLSLPEADRKRLLEGSWDVAEGAAFTEFSRPVHVVEPFEIPNNWRKFRSCDYGYGSHSAVLWFAIAPNDQLVVYRELYTTKVTAVDLAKMINRIEANEKVDYGVMDSSLWHKRGDWGPSLAQQMINEGCKWRPSDRSKGSRVAGKNEIHRRLKVDEYSGEPGIVFFETCTNLIAQLPIIPLDKNNPEDVDTKSEDHIYDALRYGIMSRPRSRSIFEFGHRASDSFTPVDRTFGY